MPFALIRSEAEWKDSPQGKYLSGVAITPVAKVNSTAPPLQLSLKPARPLEGVKVLCLTHAIAGPSAGRTLAEHGASVLQVMYTHGYEHAFVYTAANLGTASTRLNLHQAADKERLWKLVKDAHVWIDSYREGGLGKFGFDEAGLRNANPGLIISRVRCYGTAGPWAAKPGFDMQGSASSGLMVHCGENGVPAWPPGMVINDYTTGYYGALGIQAALLRRMRDGGGYNVSPSLTGTAMSILKYFKSERYPDLLSGTSRGNAPEQLRRQTAIGILKTLAPLPKLSLTPIKYDPIFLETMGSNLPQFPGYEDGYNVDGLIPMKKEDIGRKMGIAMLKRLKELKDLGKVELEKTTSKL
jgi:hypothetical protein